MLSEGRSCREFFRRFVSVIMVRSTGSYMINSPSLAPLRQAMTPASPKLSPIPPQRSTSRRAASKKVPATIIRYLPASIQDDGRGRRDGACCS